MQPRRDDDGAGGVGAGRGRAGEYVTGGGGMSDSEPEDADESRVEIQPVRSLVCALRAPSGAIFFLFRLAGRLESSFRFRVLLSVLVWCVDGWSIREWIGSRFENGSDGIDRRESDLFSSRLPISSPVLRLRILFERYCDHPLTRIP